VAACSLDSKVETHLFDTLGLAPPPIYLFMDLTTPHTPMSRRVPNLALINVHFPEFRSFGEAARTLPGLVPFFDDQDFMSEAQRSDTTPVKQTHTHTHTHTPHHNELSINLRQLR